MKSIYLENSLHQRLKTLASYENKSLTEIVSDFLEAQLNKRLTDLPASALQKLALTGHGFDFLNDPEEDVYTLEDGDPFS